MANAGRAACLSPDCNSEIMNLDELRDNRGDHPSRDNRSRQRHLPYFTLTETIWTRTVAQAEGSCVNPAAKRKSPQSRVALV